MSSRVLPGVALALALAALAMGCSQPAPTQLIVVVDTDYAIPSELDEIQIDVQGPDGLHHVETEPMVSASDLPYALSVVPQGSALGPVRIEARGLHGGAVIVTRVGRVMLVAGETRMLRLYLLRACDAAVAPACGTNQSCEGGACSSIDVTGEGWNGLPSRLGSDAGPRDAGAADAPSLDAPGLDAPGTDAFVADAPGSDAPGSDAIGPPSDTGTDAFVPPSDTGTDAPAPVDGGHDASAACATAAQCDDGNTCTTDACNGAGMCTHANNTVSCGATTCGAYGVCANASMVCSTSGTQSRTCTDRVCGGGTCGSPTRVEMAACTRPAQTGVMCGATTCGAWSACSYAGSCMPATMQSRSCTDYACDATGGCAASAPRTEMQACPQAPAGTNCARPTQCGTYACTAAGVCMPTGGQCSGSTSHCCPDIPPYCAPTAMSCLL